MISLSQVTASKPTLFHPLEPLSCEEVLLTVQLLRQADKITPSMRFVSVSLWEPSKESVHQFDGKQFPNRQAFVVLFDNATNVCHEVIVCLQSKQIIDWKSIPNVQPTMTIDEQAECEQTVIHSPLFKEALKRHYGIEDSTLVMVDIWSAGNYGSEEDRTKRLARPLCFLRSDPTDNGYHRPLEGIRPVVDLNKMEVIRIEEFGEWPLPPGEANYFSERVEPKRTGIKPLEITQPEGPSFKIEGYAVEWQNWKFVIGFNAREGLTLHHLRYNDAGEDRSILYRASLTEMVVPYGDPSPQQARKNAFDVGEYGMGMCANSLRLGCDCLGHIQYFDGNLITSRGELLQIPNAICMHEEDFGIIWKHTDRRHPDHPEVRRSRRLVISSVSTVENYEYGFFWYLYQDGNIQLELKLTGILSLGAMHPDEKPKYGNLIAKQLYAPNHQHFFNVRLDFDLDGMNNSIQQIDVVPEVIDSTNPFENAFYAKYSTMKTEKEACANLNLETARTWKVINPNRLNHVGQPVGYKFFPGDNCFPFASPNAWWRKRARFVDYHVWVTPYHPRENYAAGDFPNQSTEDHGLIRWIQQHRNIENTDLVMWYTFGHTHIPRPEDYPVMPTAYMGFLLKPNGFFTQNPANDLPPSTPKKSNDGSCCH
jgi:primary-amine oxidase